MSCCYYCKMTGARCCEPHCGLCAEYDQPPAAPKEDTHATDH